MGNRYNNEDMPVDASIAGFALDINEGKKVILYIDPDVARRIVTQLKENNGQLSDTTAKAIASTVAVAIKDLEDYNHRMLMQNEHKNTGSDYEYEEEDDPRTVFDWDKEEDEDE